MASGEVEFILNSSNVIASDGGYAGTYVPANACDGNPSTLYSSANSPAWLGIDLGSGNSAKLTRVWFIGNSASGQEKRCLPATFDYSDNTTTWTNVGAITDPLGTNCYPFLVDYDALGTMNPFVFTAPAAAHRYYRYLANGVDGYTEVAEIAFGGPYSSITGSVAWKPCRPIITPGATVSQVGLPITISSPTTDATIYYTTDGTTPALSGGVPTGTTTLYTGTLYTGSSSSPQLIKAIAYHASGTTTTSYVAAANIRAPQKFIPDSGATSGSYSLPGEIYDDRGINVNAHGGRVIYVPTKGRYYWYGQYVGNSSGGTNQERGVYCYSSADLYSWHWESMAAPLLPAGWTGMIICERPHVIYNPATTDSSKLFVMTAHVDNIGYTGGQVAIATSSTPIGPFTWQSYTSPNSDQVRDSSTFVDPNTGYTYYVADYGSSHTGIRAYQLDPATNLTSFTATVITLDTTGSREAPQLFYYGGYYYLISSALSAYQAGATQVKYKSAATLAGLSAATYSSIWASAPSSTSVAYNAQPSSVFPVQGRSGLIYAADWWSLGGLTMAAAKYAWYPIPPSAISGGVISMAAPATWDLSSLPQNPPAHPLSCLGAGN